MKITIEHEDHKIMVEDEVVVDICEAIDLMERALVQVGYDPQRVEGGLVVKAQQIKGELE